MSKQNQDEIDRNLYNIICDIWDAYRESSKLGDIKIFNEVFITVHDQYDDPEYSRFISWYGIALAPFAKKIIENRKLYNE